MSKLALLILTVFSLVSCTALSAASGKKTGSPLDNLPPYMRQITHFGERADWSGDGKKILFLERTFGDVFEVEPATGIIRPVTHHFSMRVSPGRYIWPTVIFCCLAHAHLMLPIHGPAAAKNKRNYGCSAKT
ncbi:MAG: hypothetical protein KBI46_03870 [Phycisphaerae bacterium]|nr:hypothetical protein [Phycisphaerae bacterium]